MTMTEAAVRLEKKADALWLWLDRPAESNSISPQLLDGIDHGLDVAADDPDVRSVVIAARGDIFCAGADLKHVNALLDLPATDAYSPLNQFLRRAGRTFDRLEAFPRPVVCAVQGLTIAGGLEILLCCDLVVAARSARIGDGHSTYGMIPAGGASVRLTRRLGPTRTKHLMFTGATYPAESFAGTLVSEVVDDDQLVPAVERLTATIAKRSPLGLQRMKRLVADAYDVPLEAVLRMELDQAALHSASDDFREGIGAFNEKRRPAFLGS